MQRRRLDRLLAIALFLGFAACAPRTSILVPGPDHATQPEITERDLAFRIAALTAPETEGRATGSAGEARAAAQLARALERAGLRPGGSNGDWFHTFDFTAGIALGPDNAFTLEEQAAAVDREWRPLAFSRTGAFASAPIAFVGYGLVAPAEEGHDAIDDYAEVDVRDRWVMVLRDLPQSLDARRRRTLRRHAALRYKAMIARDRGARGILFVSGPDGRFRNDVAPLRFDAALAGTSVAALSISDALAQAILTAGEPGLELGALQAEADAAAKQHRKAPVLLLEDVPLTVRVDLETRKAGGTNVLGRLQVGDRPSAQSIVIGAHFDHLGRGENAGSLADASEAGQIHPGADDNASGTALVVELAERLASRRADGDDLGSRDFVFALWSGEELGLLGSDAWVSEHVNPHSDASGPVAYLNFDMVGRLRDALVVQGLGSSEAWSEILDEAAEPLSLPVQRQQDSFVPTDATSFYKSGVPILSAFTGVHGEYHTPRDTLDKLDLGGIVRIGALFERIAESLGRRDPPLVHRSQEAPSPGGGRGGFRVFLGTIPDYARTDVAGVALSGVQPDGPAERAGLRRGDVIVGAGDQRIENLYDYTYALEAMAVGEPVRLRVLRDDAEVEFDIVPAARD